MKHLSLIYLPITSFDLGLFLGKIARVDYQGEVYEFLLTSGSNLVDSNGFHAVSRNGSNHVIKTDMHNQECIYTGEGIRHNNTRIALVGCTDKFVSGYCSQHDIIR